MGSTKLMFISSSRPLSNRRVRLEDGSEYELDDSGQLDTKLGTGAHRLEVLVDGEWIETDVEIETPGETLVVDIDDEQTGPGLMGRVLGGRYHIEASLGQGGMGTVYRARDRRLERDVAIKTLNEQLRNNDEASRLFLEEARQMAPLSHPHLVAVYDVAELDEHQLMVTEFVEGKSLEQILDDEGPMGIDDALVAGYQLAVAVAYLHDQEMIHRDLKPANAMLESDGSVKLIDFGLARSLEKLMTKGTQVRGTPAYMAPEQVTGPGPTSATDVYQLAATIYDLLTGETPGDVEQGNFIAHATAEVQAITDHRADLPQSLVELIHHCLDDDPDNRLTAHQLADELAAIHTDRTGRAPPVGISSDTGRHEAERRQRANADTLQGPPPEKTTGDDRSDTSRPADHRGPGGGPKRSGHDGSDIAVRDPDFTGATGSAEVEWNRPVAKVALIVLVIAVVFAAVVLLQFLLFEREEFDDPVDEQQATAVPEETEEIDGEAEPPIASGAEETALAVIARAEVIAEHVSGEPDAEAVDEPTGAVAAESGAGDPGLEAEPTTDDEPPPEETGASATPEPDDVADPDEIDEPDEPDEPEPTGDEPDEETTTDEADDDGSALQRQIEAIQQTDEEPDEPDQPEDPEEDEEDEEDEREEPEETEPEPAEDDEDDSRRPPRGF